MKRKLCIFTLVGQVAWSFAAFAQTTPTDGQPAGTNASVAAAPPIEVAQAQPAPESAAATTNAAVADAQAAPTTNAPVADAQPASPAAAPASADAAASSMQPGAVIPLIVMDDVPLTDAIKNLARQAGLNYMLDP